MSSASVSMTRLTREVEHDGEKEDSKLALTATPPVDQPVELRSFSRDDAFDFSFYSELGC